MSITKQTRRLIAALEKEQAKLEQAHENIETLITALHGGRHRWMRGEGVYRGVTA